MSRTITALFDSRSEAEAARTELAGRASTVQIIDQQAAGGATSSDNSGTGASHGGGFWESIKHAFMPNEDRHAYEEGVRRGGYLVCATVDEGEADEVCSILERSGAVDFDGRQDSWRSEGWGGYQPGSDETRSSGQPQQPQQPQQQQAFAGSSGTQARAEGSAVAEERIPLVEEQLKVGKREVERGGARVRSYVEERPFSEQVTLREEHVSVERRPVDQPVASGELRDSDLLKEREVEMTETAEEAVIAKEARVREEVVLKKTAEERTENIQDTVRRTDVEIEDGSGRAAGEGSDRSAFFDGGTSSSRSEDTGANSEFERDDLSRR
jgi:uncharacterized protein (TIGR02271 family)